VIAMFTNWIKYIIFIVLFASFLELLLPSSSMQRFVRVIMGLFIMLAIITPLIDLVEHHIMPGQIPAISAGSMSSSNMINTAQSTAHEYEQFTAEIYKKELTQQLEVMIMAVDGVAHAKAVIDINPANHTAGNMIKHIVVDVTPGSAVGSRIEKVSIGTSPPVVAEVHSELANKLKKMIIELYQLPQDGVEIKIVHS
jgi:stage III sporulation protein AF